MSNATHETTTRSRLWIPQAIVVAMLLWAIVPSNPYGYYTLLRLVCCGVFFFLALRAARLSRDGWAWILGGAAIVYNPVLRVHLTREVWTLVNLATIGIAVASVFALDAVETGRRSEASSEGRTDGDGDGLR
jgi:hypothetical protein